MFRKGEPPALLLYLMQDSLVEYHEIVHWIAEKRIELEIHAMVVAGAL